MSKVRRIVLAGLMLGTLVVLPACGSGGGQDPKELEGTEWRLTEAMGSTTELGGVGITIAFDGEQMGGFSGVNTYGGSYTADEDGNLELGQINSTLMAGPAPAMAAEAAYMAILQTCDGYRIKSGTLTLTEDSNDRLVFEVQEPIELSGTSWVVTGYNNGAGAVQSVALDSTLTIQFAKDGAVEGNAGVNAYSGDYTVEGAAIKIGPLATTRMAGPEELMNQEASFLLAMEKCATWSVTNGQLEMRDGESAIQITAIEQVQ